MGIFDRKQRKERDRQAAEERALHSAVDDPAAVWIAYLNGSDGAGLSQDVLEQVVGPIQDEFDRELPMIIRRSNGRYLVDALCNLDDLVEQCGVAIPKDVTSDTAGGLMVELLGHIPVPGEKVRLGNHELTVLDAEPTRVRRIEVQELTPPSAETQARESAKGPADDN